MWTHMTDGERLEFSFGTSFHQGIRRVLDGVSEFGGDGNVHTVLRGSALVSSSVNARHTPVESLGRVRRAEKVDR